MESSFQRSGSMPERRRIAVIMCSIGWLLLLLQLPAIIFWQFLDTISFPDSAPPWMSWDALMFSFPAGFVFMLYVTLALASAHAAEMESDDTGWRSLKTGFSRSNKAGS